MKKQYDTIATRLIVILNKLNQGERFTVKELSDEFNVTIRTIQRDLNERLSFLPIKKVDGYYFLEEYYLGKLNFKDIKNFATLSGIKGLYPTLDDSFISDILSTKLHQAYLIKGHNYENISTKLKEFKLVETAILDNTIVKFIYKDKPRVVKPYKLINTKGIWYLVGVEDDTIKTFSFNKILNISITDKTQDKLIVSTKVAFEDEILKIVKYWIPNIKITQPIDLQEKLEQSLKDYLTTK